MVSKIFARIKKMCRKTFLLKKKKNNNPVRWGVIGLGYMADVFSCAIDGCEDGVVFAVASRSINKAKSFAKKHGCCNAFGSYEEMVYNDSLNLDVIYVATPVKYHYKHVKLCLEAGKNVLCEKPITHSLDELEELRKIAKKNNCFLMEGMWMKCLPSFRKACGWINDGRVGGVELVKADLYKRKIIRDSEYISNDLNEDGVLYDFGVYAVAFMEHFLGGYPDCLSAGRRESIYGIDTDWLISAKRGNVQAFVNLSSNFGAVSKAAVIGQKGFVEWDSQFNRTNIVSLYNGKGVLVERFSCKYEYEGFEYEVDEVQKCIREGKKESGIVDLSSSHNVQKILNECNAL